MRINKGVEWAAHACALLAVLPEGWALSSEALAEFHGVPPAYMAKQLQALSRAGLAKAQRGAAGGYRLARPVGDISLWDIAEAVEGPQPAFRCTEIRQNGPCGASPEACRTPCGIAAAFYAAETAFRESLRQVRLTDLIATVAAQSDAAHARSISDWIEMNAAKAPA